MKLLVHLTNRSKKRKIGQRLYAKLAKCELKVKPFKHAGTIILEEIRRSEGTTLKREGKGWKSVVHQMKKELPVSVKAVAKYVATLTGEPVAQLLRDELLRDELLLS